MCSLKTSNGEIVSELIEVVLEMGKERETGIKEGDEQGGGGGGGGWGGSGSGGGGPGGCWSPGG